MVSRGRAGKEGRQRKSIRERAAEKGKKREEKSSLSISKREEKSITLYYFITSSTTL